MSPLRLACLALAGWTMLGAGAGPAMAAPFALVCSFTTADERIERVTLVADGALSGPVSLGGTGSGQQAPVPLAGIQIGTAEWRSAAGASVGPVFNLTVVRAIDADGGLAALITNDVGAVVNIVEVATDLPVGEDGHHAIMSSFGEILVGTCRA